MHIYTVSPSKPWILDSEASSHMTGITQKFVSLNMSIAHPSVKITDGTHSPVLGNEVVQATSLTLTGVLYVLDSINVMSISQLTKQNNCKITFFFLLIVWFRTYRLGRGLVRGMSEKAYTIWMIE